MAELTTRRRKSLPKSEFGLPEERVPDAGQVARANAKARAAQQRNEAT